MSDRHMQAGLAIGQKWGFDLNHAREMAFDIALALATAEHEGMKRAYLAGFAASAEGLNGEYPFSDRGLNPQDDADWCEMRDRFIAAILSEAGEG